MEKHDFLVQNESLLITKTIIYFC